MMKMITVLVLLMLAMMLKGSTGSLVRRYLGYVLVGVGAFLWASSVDAAASGDVVSDAHLYRRVLLLSAFGVVASLSGLIAALLCQYKPLKVAIILLGVG